MHWNASMATHTAITPTNDGWSAYCMAWEMGPRNSNTSVANTAATVPTIIIDVE